MGWRVASTLSAAMLCAAAAQAQTCEQFRDRLAERVDPASRGFALEIVPGTTPLPPGAKVWGNCEGGARKILFFRNGAQAAAWRAEASGASAPAPAGRASAASAAMPAARPAERGPAAERAATPAAAALPASAPVASTRTPPATPVAPMPAQVAAAPADSDVAGGIAAPAPAASIASAGDAATGKATDTAAGPSLVERLRRHWPWIAVPLGLLAAGLLWAWLAHRRAYDAYGLPRGPKLRP